LLLSGPATSVGAAADICKQATPAGWTFNSKKDSSGNDLGSDSAAAATGNWTVLAAVCAANPFCIGINGGGWYKHTLASPSQWTTSGSDPCKGLLVKNGEKRGPAQHRSTRWFMALAVVADPLQSLLTTAAVWRCLCLVVCLQTKVPRLCQVSSGGQSLVSCSLQP
jgi:hypothetical protein